jgi:hypothetical protein
MYLVCRWSPLSGTRNLRCTRRGLVGTCSTHRSPSRYHRCHSPSRYSPACNRPPARSTCRWGSSRRRSRRPPRLRRNTRRRTVNLSAGMCNHCRTRCPLCPGNWSNMYIPAHMSARWRSSSPRRSRRIGCPSRPHPPRSSSRRHTGRRRPDTCSRCRSCRLRPHRSLQPNRSDRNHTGWSIGNYNRKCIESQSACHLSLDSCIRYRMEPR